MCVKGAQAILQHFESWKAGAVENASCVGRWSACAWINGAIATF